MREQRDEIRLKLYRNQLTNNGLNARLAERGVSADNRELSSVLRGVRKGPKADNIIATAVEILQHYEQVMGVEQ